MDNGHNVTMVTMMLRRFVVLGVVPFTSITYLNYKIYCVVR